MATTHSPTWLITGASSGMGKSIALEALNSRCKVIGTTRDISKAETSFPDFITKGGIWIDLDPAQKDAFEQFSNCTREYDIDVLVNNASYAFIGGVEDTSGEDETRDQMEVNFYGPLSAVRACLPVMRAKEPDIVVISSGARFIARPARSSYSASKFASKFAIEAVYESLSHEIKTFGIKVLIVEPGAFRTPFTGRIITPAQFRDSNGFSEAYDGTAVAQMVNATVNIMSIPNFVKWDPENAARAIFMALVDGHDYLRMPLEPDCVSTLKDKIGQLWGDLEATRGIFTAMKFY
ncbi:hypothetical protein NHQ30_004002 [Ciborinia camelliae]|nr:hypothetical protein NHQ30_004002 [Ciborinia camelliae]